MVDSIKYHQYISRNSSTITLHTKLFLIKQICDVLTYL